MPPCLNKPAQACDAWLLDMDGDGQNEMSAGPWHRYALVGQCDETGFKARRLVSGWPRLASPSCHGSLSAMRAGRIALADPHWRDLLVNGMRLTPAPGNGGELPCPR